MFTPHLYTHKYDIDDLIQALCSPEVSYLNTENGSISSTPTPYKLEPLPQAFLAQLPTHREFQRLTPPEQTELHPLLQQSLHQLFPLMQNQTRLGGWLRERVKEAALDWLDENNLIPPSMKHLNRQKASDLYATTISKVTIQEE